MGMRRSILCLVALVSLVLALVPVAAEDISAEKIVEELKRTLAHSLLERPRVSIIYSGSYYWSGPAEEVLNGWYRRDADRFDFGSTGLQEAPGAKMVARRRWVIDEGLRVNYAYGFDSGTRVEPSHASYRALPRDKQDFARAVRAEWRAIGPLSGVIPGDGGASVVELLRSCPDLEMKGDMLTIDGHGTYVVRADTDNGEYTVWLDPESGFLPRQIRVCKQGDDLLYGRPLSYVNHERIALGMRVMPERKKWTFFVRSIEIERVGEYRAIMGFSSEECTEYVTGDQKVVRGDLHVTEVHLTPDFDDTDAFEMDLPDGTPMRPLDNRGPQLEWRDGRVVLYEDGKYVPYRRMLLPGDQSPELDVAAWVNGDGTALEPLPSGVAVLSFWDSTHESSAKVIEVLNGVKKEYPNVLVVAVHSADGNHDDVKQLVRTQNIRFRVAVDKPAGHYKGATFEAYRVEKVPAVFIIDAEGKVTYQDIPLAAVEEAVKTLVEDASTADNWGRPVDGLRCRWVQPTVQVRAGTRPTVSAEVQNVSERPIFWACWNEMSWGFAIVPDAGWTMPKFQARAGPNARPASAREVRTEFNLGRPDLERYERMGSERVSFFRLDPGGQLTLTCELRWQFEKPGQYGVECAIYRYYPVTSVERPFEEVAMTCAPLSLDVVTER